MLTAIALKIRENREKIELLRAIFRATLVQLFRQELVIKCMCLCFQSLFRINSLWLYINCTLSGEIESNDRMNQYKVRLNISENRKSYVIFGIFFLTADVILGLIYSSN